MKNRKKAAALWAAACVSAVLSGGCGNNAENGEQVVAPREQEAGQMTVVSDTRADTASGNVAGQVRAPERYQAQVSSDTVSLTADAAVIIPDVKGIKTKKVTARVFTQADYDAVNRALLGGEKLWERDYAMLRESHGFYKEELDEKIAKLELELANGVDADAPYGGKPVSLKQQIAELKALREKAPTEEEAVSRGAIKEVPAVVAYDAALSATGENELYGNATVNGQDYFVQIDNNATEAVHSLLFLIEKTDGDGNYTPLSNTLPDLGELGDIMPRPGLENMSSLPEEVQTRAQEAVKQMGIGEFAFQGGAYYACWSADELDPDGTVYLAGIGYGMHFARIVDGIPVTYTFENGGLITEDDSYKWEQAVLQSAGGEAADAENAVIMWPYEEMTLIYNDDGFRTFEWKNPYTVEDLSEEYVFLLPFSDISDIFETMLLKKQADSFNNEGDTVDIQVDRAVLSYMRVREKGSVEGTLIPVWDFYGTKTFKNAAGEVELVNDNAFESLLTVNAMDGTVIDRWLGF